MEYKTPLNKRGVLNDGTSSWVSQITTFIKNIAFILNSGFYFLIKPKQVKKNIMEVMKMTKTLRQEIVVKDLKNNKEHKIQAEQTPREAEPGVSEYIKVNHRGIAKLQARIGVNNFVSTKTFQAFLKLKLGLEDEDIGPIANLRNPKEAVNWEVYVGGNKLFPKAGASPITEHIEEPMAAGVPADTTEDPVVGQIKSLISKGTPHNDIKRSLIKKLGGKEEAKRLWDIATTIPKVEEVDLFQAPKVEKVEEELF